MEENGIAAERLYRSIDDVQGVTECKQYLEHVLLVVPVYNVGNVYKYNILIDVE